MKPTENFEKFVKENPFFSGVEKSLCDHVGLFFCLFVYPKPKLQKRV
jgi:hypothetical protein